MMAIVKIKFVRHLAKLAKYVMDGRNPNDPVQTFNCSESSLAEEFTAHRNFQRGKGAVDAIHIIQSWGDSESKSLSAEGFNEIGKELVERQFPGHAYAVVTHTDTAKVHNHIIVCPWHSETGKKIENKKRQLYELRAISDTLCKDRGLSVIDIDAKDRPARLSDKVQKIAQFRGGSWVIDLCQKADFARAYATSYDQYVSILGEFGVKAQVEEKNISYFYSEKVRGKRGSKIGDRYDKSGLEKAFGENAAKFAKFPGLGDQVRGIVVARASGKVSHADSQVAMGKLSESTYQEGQRDYGKFSKTERSGRAQRFPHELDGSSSIIPIEELRRARQTNIIQYCGTNKIPLEHTPDGTLVLKGRTFVEIHAFDWVNNRNRTKGSLIELVAAHKDMTYLQAVAEINGNSRLLLLEKHLGETKCPFRSFYIPKEQQLQNLDAKVRIATLLSEFGADPRHSPTLYKSGQVQVSREGVIRIFGKEDQGGAFEFVEGGDKKWKKTKVGTFNTAFFSVSQGSKKLSVYLDPFSFLKSEGKHALWPAHYQSDILCLMEPQERALDHHLAGNRHIEQIEIFTDHSSQNHPAELDFFNNLRTRYSHLGISVGNSHGHDLGRSRQTELPSM
jgi:hypothetical protein